jgi:hypothetical protein
MRRPVWRSKAQSIRASSAALSAAARLKAEIERFGVAR